MTDARPDLLFLCHRIPYPPNKGDKIRSFHWLMSLVKHFRVHLGAFVDDPSDWAHAGRLQRECASTYFAPLRRSKATLGSLSGFLEGAPLTFPYYRDRGMHHWVQERLSRCPIQYIFVFSAAMAQYAQHERWATVRRVIDFVDVDSDKWRQYASTRHWPASWVYRREAERLQVAESKLARVFDASILVSDHEADLFRSLLAGVACRVEAINNGVDIGYFAYDDQRPSPYPPSAEPVVFTGAMDYWANVDAVVWFVREIWPLVLEKRPRALFSIVGARPTPDVLALANSNVQVSGSVPDVRPYLQHARVVVAPMRIARGIQNKVLEGMAMEKPVVVTSRGFEGLHAVPGRDLLVCDEPEVFAAQILSLFDGAGSTIGESARRRVAERYDWAYSSQRLMELVLGRDLGLITS